MASMDFHRDSTTSSARPPASRGEHVNFAIRREGIDPLGRGGSLRYRVAVFDHRADRPVEVPPQSAPPEAVLLFDGIFLLRPELDDAWDYRIFVEVSPETSGRRGTARDRTEERYRARYLPAQRSVPPDPWTP